MTARVEDVRTLLDQAAGGAVEIPASVFADPDAAALVFPGGTVRIGGAVCDSRALWVGGQAAITASSAPVDIAFTVDGEWVTGTVAAVDLGAGRSLVLVDGAPEGTALPAGAWALTDGKALRLARRAPAPPTDPERLDGLGRALPARQHRDGATRDLTPRALVTEHGILTPVPGRAAARACASSTPRRCAAGPRSAPRAARTA